MGIPPEDIEYGTRRMEAIGVMIIGLILVIMGPFICIYAGTTTQTSCGPRQDPNFGAFAVVEILGWSLLLYGNYLYDKVKHVTWTKQAIREYEREEYIKSFIYNPVVIIVALISIGVKWIGRNVIKS